MDSEETREIIASEDLVFISQKGAVTRHKVTIERPVSKNDGYAYTCLVSLGFESPIEISGVSSLQALANAIAWLKSRLIVQRDDFKRKVYFPTEESGLAQDDPELEYPIESIFPILS